MICGLFNYTVIDLFNIVQLYFCTELHLYTDFFTCNIFSRACSGLESDVRSICTIHVLNSLSWKRQLSTRICPNKLLVSDVISHSTC